MGWATAVVREAEARPAEARATEARAGLEEAARAAEVMWGKVVQTRTGHGLRVVSSASM
jgi:hypothetical protein